jgi:hypothetical protein
METVLDDLLLGLRVRVLDDVVSAVLEERLTHRFKINDACFCPVEEQLGAFERFKIIHGKNRPNKRPRVQTSSGQSIEPKPKRHTDMKLGKAKAKKAKSPAKRA